MLDPVPRRFTVCPHLFLPRCHRPSPSKEWVGFPRFVPRITTSHRSVFRGCRYSLMFRPPSLLSPQIVPTAAPTAAGQPGILRPGLSCFVTSTRTGYANRLTQAIDGTGTFTLSDSQPCRLLTLLLGRYSASALIRTHPPPSRRRSISRLSRLYDLPCSGDFSPGRGRLLQLLGMSLSPCCRFHPAEVMVPCRSDFGTPCCLHPSVAGSALGAIHFRGHIHVHCRYGPVTRDLPEGDLVDRLQDFGFPPPCYPNYGAPDCCPGRSTSC